MMFNIIGAYINRLTKEDIRNFSLSKGANFSEEEINFPKVKQVFNEYFQKFNSFLK